jgi:CRP/FNR family transcriptional regulator
MPEETNCKECMQSSDCFKELVRDELEFVNKNKTQISYAKGENLCKQGAFSSSILYITEGLVKIYLENSNKKTTNIRILKAQDFIGLSSIFGDNIYNYSAVALKETQICLIEKQSFHQLLQKNAMFASSLIKKYCETESNLFDKIRSISYKQMHGRLADVLLYLDSEHLRKEDIYKSINRKDIADFACISKESTIKLLSEFNNDGIIELEGKSIIIKDKPLLKSISKRG